MGHLNKHPLLGQPAPDLTLMDQTGHPFHLSEWLGKKAFVLYFYPKNFTAVCTTQSCLFRDLYGQFQEADIDIIGISMDSTQSHQSFSSQFHLPFPLLSDPKGDAQKRYQVPKALGLFPGRITYAVDQQGVIRLVFSDMFNAQAHIDAAKALLLSR